MSDGVSDMNREYDNFFEELEKEYRALASLWIVDTMNIYEEYRDILKEKYKPLINIKNVCNKNEV